MDIAIEAWPISNNVMGSTTNRSAVLSSALDPVVTCSCIGDKMAVELAPS